jgi:hypothetical protein
MAHSPSNLSSVWAVLPILLRDIGAILQGAPRGHKTSGIDFAQRHKDFFVPVRPLDTSSFVRVRSISYVAWREAQSQSPSAPKNSLRA